MKISRFKNGVAINGDKKNRWLFQRFIRNNCGTTAIEYSLIGSLVAVGIIGGVNSSGESLDTTFTAISAAFSSALEPAPVSISPAVASVRAE